MKLVEGDAGNRGAHALEEFQEGVAVGAALHAGEDVAAGVLERHVDVFGEAFVGGEGLEHFLRYAIRVGVEEADPEEVFDLCEALEELREAIAEAEVFAVGSGVLADERDFAGTYGGEVFRFADDGFETAAAEGAAELRDDAEGAGVVATFGDFDVGLMLGGGDDAWGEVVIEERRRLGGQNFQVAFDGFDDAFDFAGADDGVYFGNLLEDLVAVAFNEAAGDD